MRKVTRWAIGLVLLSTAGACLAFSQAMPGLPWAAGDVAFPSLRPFDEKLVGELKAPPGFEIGVFARDLGNARNLAVAPDGAVYVTQRSQGTVTLLRDTDGDGRADEKRVVAENLGDVNGILIRDGLVYLGPATRILVADREADGRLGPPRTFIAGLPEGGNHPNRTLGFSPDGKHFFVSVGSTCNACIEANELHGTLLRFNADGSGRTIFARGLRNTIGFDWHPATGELWGLDHGSDWRGNDQPPEELNRIREGLHYGWPFCWNDRKVDTAFSPDPPGTTKAAFCPTTEPPVLTYQAHSSPLDLLFYTGSQFPSDWRHDAIVTFRGSWNRNPPTGYKVARVRFENGQPTRFEDFVTGFLAPDGQSMIGRPVGLAQDRDGSVLLADDNNGVIYRIRYKG
ncbi:MAG: sorbosone dehydrogenase family protein [Candidatus Sericytochromatia bacterium]|nr:sorbosone dehydrogenase family protein [Candidatus Tanganyikabacteria bacterium]